MKEHVIERGRASRAAVDGRAGGRGWSGLAWRQYRLERKMFWRNPSAAFFNFMLPLLFLGFFGALLHNDQDLLQVIVPGIAGMAVMSTTFNALAFNITALRELGILKRVRGTPLPTSAYLAGIGGSAVTNTTVADPDHHGRRQACCSGSTGRQNLLSLAFFVALGVVCFASLGVALSHAIPNFDAAPAYVNAAFLPLIFISGVFYEADDAPARDPRRRPGAAAQAPDRRPLRGDGPRRGRRPPPGGRARPRRLGRRRAHARRARLLLGIPQRLARAQPTSATQKARPPLQPPARACSRGPRRGRGP